MFGHVFHVQVTSVKRGLRIIPFRYAIARLPPGNGWPWWATWSDGLAAMVRTPAECSIVCEERLVPDAVTAERGYVAFEVEGPIPFGEVGVLAGLTAALADAGISVFVVSTWDTDYILVQAGAADAASAVWRGSGYRVTTA